jgi:hypothetical protein
LQFNRPIRVECQTIGKTSQQKTFESQGVIILSKKGLQSETIAVSGNVDGFAQMQRLALLSEMRCIEKWSRIKK